MQHASATRYQELSSEYSVGDTVQLLEGSVTDVGRVVAVWAAIGMVDVHLGGTTTRFPVEDLLRLNPEQSVGVPASVEFNEIPGGQGTVPVSGGPVTGPSPLPRFARVAEAFVKKSIYWASRDRQYRATKGETDSGEFGCPKCKSAILSQTIYKRREGKSATLMCCSSCLFTIKREDFLPTEGVV
jgi:hypothetical protein